jgi:hypothetical protein
LRGTETSVLLHGLSPTGSNKACPRENGDAYLTKILETKPSTFNEIKQAVNSMLEFASTNALSKNEKLADGYFKIKSKRLKKKCAA